MNYPRAARHPAAIAVAAILLTACGGSSGDGTDPTPLDPVAALASCGTRTALFTVSPIALSEVHGWVPLGNISPPLHTFPTAHQYLFHTLAGTPLHTVPVVSPGDIVIIGASQRTYSADSRTDYTVIFASCREVTGLFNHLATVDPSFSSRLAPFDQMCFTSSSPPAYSDCSSRPLSIPIAAGAPLGTAGGVPGLLAWDFGLRDARRAPIAYANPARWHRGGVAGDLLHVVAPSDYYAEPVASEIAGRLGRGDGSERRTAPPIGGSLDFDVAGTAQGAWFNSAQLTEGAESPHLAIVPGNIDPTEFAVSGSTSLPGYGSRLGYWRPAASGLVNPAPRTIVPDGQIRCLNLFNGRSLLLLLADATTLRVEALAAGVNCATQQPWTFTGAAFDFHR
jgi:hypothetical protein